MYQDTNGREGRIGDLEGHRAQGTGHRAQGAGRRALVAGIVIGIRYSVFGKKITDY